MKSVGMLTFLLVLSLVACRKQDIRTVTIQVPGLKNAACAKLIQDAFMRQPGIVSVRPDFEKKQVIVSYNSMVIALKNLEYVIAGAGFDADDTKAAANAVAALPPECK